MNGIKRGALIVIEGVDRSGKSTQCKRLVESLLQRQMKAQLVTFPDRTTVIGDVIDKYLKHCNDVCDEAIHLLFCANRWEKRKQMEQLLKEGVTLIVDRYSYSGVVYSSIKKDMDLQWCEEPEKGLLKPDLVFLLKLNQTDLEKRPDFGTERYENATTQEKVAAAFMRMSEQPHWEVIAAERSIETVQKELLGKTLNKILQIQTQPLSVLNEIS